MKIKNQSYMNNQEFKDRQNSFSFFCAQAYDYLKTFRDECRSGWKKLFSRTTKTPQQLSINFIRNILEWADWQPEKNRELFN